MKKYLIIATLFLAAIIILPANAYSQYTGWSTPINNYLRYRMNNRIIRNAARKPAKKNAVHRKKRIVRKKSQRVSVLENLSVPKLKMNADLPKRSAII